MSYFRAAQLRLVETLARTHGMATPQKVNIDLFKNSFMIWSNFQFISAVTNEVVKYLFL
jgi:hypothetical protein